MESLKLLLAVLMTLIEIGHIKRKVPQETANNVVQLLAKVPTQLEEIYCQDFGRSRESKHSANDSGDCNGPGTSRESWNDASSASDSKSHGTRGVGAANSDPRTSDLRRNRILDSSSAWSGSWSHINFTNNDENISSSYSSSDSTTLGQ